MHDGQTRGRRRGDGRALPVVRPRRLPPPPPTHVPKHLLLETGCRGGRGDARTPRSAACPLAHRPPPLARPAARCDPGVASTGLGGFKMADFPPASSAAGADFSGGWLPGHPSPSPEDSPHTHTHTHARSPSSQPRPTATAGGREKKGREPSSPLSSPSSTRHPHAPRYWRGALGAAVTAEGREALARGARGPAYPRGRQAG